MKQETMSIHTMVRVWNHSQAAGNNLLVMLALADRADEDGVCWPGADFIAKRSRLSVRTVHRIIKKLEKTEELLVFRRRRPDGTNHTNYYIIAVGLEPERLDAVIDRIAANLRPGDKMTPSHSDKLSSSEKRPQPSDKSGPSQVTPVSPDPSSYTSVEEHDLSSSWRLILGELEHQMTRATYNAHLAGSTARLDRDRLIITVANERAAAWLQERLDVLVNRTAASVIGRPIDIHYEIKQ